jgi:tetratricopeptide (TPR) repeat protein
VFRPFTITLSGMIGRRDFDKAIEYLRSNLKGKASDLSSLEMIAHCHYWAGKPDDAIKAGHEALKCDSRSFDMHVMLSQLYAERAEHENAAIHARKGLESYPEPLPKLPNFIVTADKLLRHFFPQLGAYGPDEALKRIEAEHANWFDWAKKYLAWYDSTYGDNLEPLEN